MHPRTQLVRNILMQTAMEFGITFDDIKSKNKQYPNVDAHDKAVYRIYTQTRYSYAQISVLFERRFKTWAERSFARYVKKHKIKRPENGWKERISVKDENQPLLPYLFEK